MVSAFPIPLNAIRAIEIVARRGALAPAAEELGVTPGAVSQHIRRAEERLGLELFERTPQGLKPTPALKQIVPQLREGFQVLENALAGLKRDDDRVLTLTLGSVFASRWLIWRIGRFSSAHPEIEVRLVVTGSMLDMAHSDIDCGIRFGTGRWDGVSAELVGGTRYRPVVAPPLAGRLKVPADLLQVPVIRDTSTMLSWDAWFKAVGFAAPLAVNGPTYDDPALAFDAAISEQGVLLTVDEMAADAVSDGRLVHPFESFAESGVGYWFVTAEGRRRPKKVTIFRDWLLAEFANSKLGYVEQMARRKERG